MSEWIKCTNKLPDACVEVLVTDRVNVETMWLDGNGRWDSWVDIGGRSICTLDITHWMPFPNLPAGY